MSAPAEFKLNTGATIPAIGLGTWQAKPGEVRDAVSHALKNGYTHLDCALCYQVCLGSLYGYGVGRAEDGRGGVEQRRSEGTEREMRERGAEKGERGAGSKRRARWRTACPGGGG